jgi:alkylation response protein AidB-like acyl-CoA dehydrogenase
MPGGYDSQPRHGWAAHAAPAVRTLRRAGLAGQVLGGIGFTWEHPAHLYFRQARSSAVPFGTEPQHRATLADRLGL